MRFELKYRLSEFTNHVYWGIKEQLKNGYCIYSLDQKTLRICSASNFELIKEIEYPTNLSILLQDDLLFTWKNGITSCHDLKDGTVETIIERDYKIDDYANFLTSNHLYESTRRYENFELIKKLDNVVNISTNKVIWTNENQNVEIFNYGLNFFEYDKVDKLIRRFDHIDGKQLWEQQFSMEIDPRFTITSKNYLYLLTSKNFEYKLCKLNLVSGEKEWESRLIGNRFYLHGNRIFGLSGQTLFSLDINDGKQLESLEIDFLTKNDSHVSSHLTDLEDSNLFFTTTFGSGSNKKAVVGHVNLDDMSINTHELEINKKADIRGPIGRPIIIANTAYIEFSPHLLEKYNYAI